MFHTGYIHTSFLCPNPSSINAICIGSGRFLRSVLVPALRGVDLNPIIIQTRGRSFLDYTLDRVNLNQQLSKNESDLLTYEVDTVNPDGTILTSDVDHGGAGTLGTKEGKDAVLSFIKNDMREISIIGVGVTEAGLSSCASKSIVDISDVLYECFSAMKASTLQCKNPNGRICIVNTDNIPGNGALLRRYILELSSQIDVERHESNDNNVNTFHDFVENRVSFLDTMVDRITSERKGSNGLVPRAEPTPLKALVIEDLDQDLPLEWNSPNMRKNFGVVIRTKRGELSGDIALKLRVANGTHTAVAHVMALCKLLMTDMLSTSDSSSKDHDSHILMAYLDSLFYHQILPAAADSFGKEETEAVYKDWRGRLMHAHFGLSTFFITQNGAAKGGIRLGPTVKDLIGKDENGDYKITCTTVYAFAAILRFLTPSDVVKKAPTNGVYRGWLEGSQRYRTHESKDGNTDTIVYADGLCYNLNEGWYEFRCGCNLTSPFTKKGDDRKPLPLLLSLIPTPSQPCCYESIIREYLVANDGGNLLDEFNDPSCFDAFEGLVKAIATVYARMVAGDGMLNLLRCMVNDTDIYEHGLATKSQILIDGVTSARFGGDSPLHYRVHAIPGDSNVINASIGFNVEDIRNIIFSEVASTSVIDLHTHLLPPSRGAASLWGIDELLTYHYLVSEYFITAPPDISPEDFYALDKKEQADMIWNALFIDRSPISEACRGVITTLNRLGLNKEISNRDLNGIRRFFEDFRLRGDDGSEEYCKRVFKNAGVKYCIMTNNPFEVSEAKYWHSTSKNNNNLFRSALRVDPFLTGEETLIRKTLEMAGYPPTIEGCCQYLHDWCDTMKPEYMMVSTPHNFVLPEDKGSLGGVKVKSVNKDALRQPFAFTDISSSVDKGGCGQCNEGEDAIGSVIDENSDFLSDALMKVCEERNLPIALKIGAHRKLNPKLLDAGDGLASFVDTDVLARLCTRFPNVRFLATFLSRKNQHEACVLASKFRNLHIYGCWWFCNNPSIIEEITSMRVEMLGTAFTAQHSDARVLDQLIYKWAHSRAVIAEVLTKSYIKMTQSGWNPTRLQIRRDIERLFGKSYEEFMAKKL